MEIAIAPAFREHAKIAGFVFLLIALIFVVRSFYAMRIPVGENKQQFKRKDKKRGNNYKQLKRAL